MTPIVGVSRITLLRELREIQAKGVIERIGSNRKGSWKVNL